MASMRQIVEKATGKPITKDEIDAALDRMTEEDILPISGRTVKREDGRILKVTDNRAIDKITEVLEQEGITDPKQEGAINGGITALMCLAYVWGQREYLRGATAKWSKRRHA